MINQNKKLSQDIEHVLHKLGITRYKKFGTKRISLACPIHHGDNPSACCLYIDDNLLIPTWKCYTHKCEERCGKTLVNFVGGILGKNYYQTLEWLQYDLEEDDSIGGQIDLINSTRVFSNQRNKSKLKVSREKVVDSLVIPAPYYEIRSFSPSVLEKYDVGVCLNKNKTMYNRVVVPIYDKNHKYMIGCIGRSLYEQCVLCDTYHDPKKICPVSETDRHKYCKWMITKDFPSESYFYNYWFAKDLIRSTGKVFLVEGQSDVWRFAECNIFNVLGMFGSSLKPQQRVTLEKSGATDLIIFTDPDEAGDKCRKQIEDSVGRIYNIHHVICEKDPGDCTKEELFNLVEKYL
jgi:5S rRNA maturation endonuclease (ribonuclease M5)